jgi:hypothetical protein
MFESQHVLFHPLAVNEHLFANVNQVARTVAIKLFLTTAQGIKAHLRMRHKAAKRNTKLV